MAFRRLPFDRVAPALVVAAAGDRLAVSAPARPAQRVASSSASTKVQGLGTTCQESLNLCHCEPDGPGSLTSSAPCSSAWWAVAARKACASTARVMCRSVPAHVTADFVLVQAALVLRGLKAPLNCPACPGDPHQLLNGGLQGGVDEVVGDLVRPADAATARAPSHSTGELALVVELSDGGQPDRRPVVDARSHRAVTARDLPPLRPETARTGRRCGSNSQ